MLKRCVRIVIAGILCLSLAGCQSTSSKDDDRIKVALVTSTGGLGDRSFSDAAWAGFGQAEKDLGVVIKVVEPQSVADYQATISAIASAGYDYILGVGTDQYDALEMCANQYPDTKFGGLNIKLQADNLQVAQFADHEGSFMAGALAAKCSKSGTVGFLGGANIPTINRFYVGFEEGVKYVNPDIKVLCSYIGSFADPGKGKEFANQMFLDGADVIFHAAGKSGEGLFQAVKEKEGVYAIGVDQNQDYIAKGKILSSMEKRVNIAAYEMIKSVVENRFESGYRMYGIKEKGVGLTEMEFTKDLVGEQSIQELGAIEDKIVSGEIKVTDILEQK